MLNKDEKQPSYPAPRVEELSEQFLNSMPKLPLPDADFINNPNFELIKTIILEIIQNLDKFINSFDQKLIKDLLKKQKFFTLEIFQQKPFTIMHPQWSYIHMIDLWCSQSPKKEPEFSFFLETSLIVNKHLYTINEKVLMADYKNKPPAKAGQFIIARFTSQIQAILIELNKQ